MKTRRLIWGNSGGLSPAGIRPSSETRDSSTIARAKKPNERSLRLPQLTTVTRPSSMKAIAPAFSR